MIFTSNSKRKLNQTLDIVNTIQTNFLESWILSLRSFIMPKYDLKPKIRENHFLLFSYNKHLLRNKRQNLGDYVQTIATKNALMQHFPKANFSFIDRDSLVGFCGDGANSSLNALTPVIMQGWFAHSTHCIPNNETLPIFVGTHFTERYQEFLEAFISYYPWYFQDKEIGCRDLYTLEFCQNLRIKSYFSRCLTLTLPKREKNVEQNKVFFVNIPKELHPYIPTHLKENAVEVNQQGVGFEGGLDWQSSYSKTESLLEAYKNQAKLVITCALHCAAPCVAMGIPVILIARNEENLQRFSAVSGILRVWTQEELKNGKVDFNPSVLEIESLKKDMLENLSLSIQKAMGKRIDEVQLEQIRQRIAEFKTEKSQEMDKESQLHLSNCAGGGGNRLVENTWKVDFAYDLEFKQRAQILLDLLSLEVRKSLKSVLDLGCGVQYFKEVLGENGLNPYYCGVDLYLQKPNNILCDFNKGEFPSFYSGDFDLIVCAGLFEYLYDLPQFINKICALSPSYFLCSYNFDKISEQNKIWVKRLNQAELLNLFLQKGYCLKSYQTHQRKNATGYFCFCKQEFMSR